VAADDADYEEGGGGVDSREHHARGALELASVRRFSRNRERKTEFARDVRPPEHLLVKDVANGAVASCLRSRV